MFDFPNKSVLIFISAPPATHLRASPKPPRPTLRTDGKRTRLRGGGILAAVSLRAGPAGPHRMDRAHARQPCFTARASSAKGTVRCSPVSMFLSVAAPASNSCEPTIATWGIPRRLAYSICFFILAGSG